MLFWPVLKSYILRWMVGLCIDGHKSAKKNSSITSIIYIQLRMCSIVIDNENGDFKFVCVYCFSTHVLHNGAIPWYQYFKIAILLFISTLFMNVMVFSTEMISWWTSSTTFVVLKMSSAYRFLDAWYFWSYRLPTLLFTIFHHKFSLHPGHGRPHHGPRDQSVIFYLNIK